jgi:hypothetical protein
MVIVIAMNLFSLFLLGTGTLMSLNCNLENQSKETSINTVLVPWTSPSTVHPSTDIFKNVLIVGASVSADWNTSSPGKRLGRKFGGPNSPVTVARGGAPGKEMIHQMNGKLLKDRSAIIGIDFLFWDSVESSTQSSILALQKLIQLGQEHKIPVILGNIPELLPGRQISRKYLNQKISEACERLENCFLMNLDQLHQQVVKEGLRIGNQVYSIEDLVPDGLHLSDVAAHYIAERIQNVIADKA